MPLKAIEIPAQTLAKKAMIWLHGLGADANDFVPLIPELKLPEPNDIRFIFPYAPVVPVSINNGYHMPAWYDIHGIALDSKIDHAGIELTVKNIHELLDNEVKRGVDSNQIILAGFSQGAVITLIAGLTYRKALGGLIALSGYFPLAEKTLETITANKDTPIFIAHGTQDPIVNFMLGMQSANKLKDAHLNVEWHSYDMPHTVCPPEIHDISAWVKKIWGF